MDPGHPAPGPWLSVVVLAWDQLHHTRRCIASIREHTDVPYELIIVDNGSAPEAAAFAEEAADVAVLNDANLGFAGGMNRGLERARGDHVAFVNNDAVVPERWASRLLEHFSDGSDVAMVVPAVTAAGDKRIVRAEAGTAVERFTPFDAPPPAVLVVLPTALLRELGGWDEGYQVASGEDLELSFALWTNGRDVLLDERVLVEHVSKGTAAVKLPDWQALWIANRRQFLERWTDAGLEVPRLSSCPPELHASLRDCARGAALWMQRYFDVLGELNRSRQQEAATAPRTPARRLARLRRRRWGSG